MDLTKNYKKKYKIKKINKKMYCNTQYDQENLEASMIICNTYVKAPARAKFIIIVLKLPL